MKLPIYQPTVDIHSIYDPQDGVEPVLQYNHDVDIIRFKGQFYAAWNANTEGAEDVPGQYNFLSVSPDFRVWTRPVRPFTRDGGAGNAVDDDNQWQPSLLNLGDEVLIAVWSTFTGRKVFVSESRDGKTWNNREVAAAPAGLLGKAVGFPTNHAIISSKGVLMVPCSVPFTDRERCRVGDTRYAGILMSRDKGKTWAWSDPIEAQPWSVLDPALVEHNGDICTIWEPSIWEYPDGRMGLVIRNSTSQDAPKRTDKSHHMLLYSESLDHGQTWTKARSVEVDTICSRSFVWTGVGQPGATLMVHNDQWVNTPRRISHDRFHLALWFSPTGDPDLYLPGPVVQPTTGYGFYPNGFVENGRLYVAYTYPSQILGSVVNTLPDFTAPFLLPREGRPGLVLHTDEALLTHRTSTLGLVLTEPLTRCESLELSFVANVDRYRTMVESTPSFPILTLGGKTRDGGVLWLRRRGPGDHRLVWRAAAGLEVDVGVFQLKKAFAIRVRIGGRETAISVDGGADQRVGGAVLRKIAFGGLYEKPEWIMDGHTEHPEHASSVQIATPSIRVRGT